MFSGHAVAGYAEHGSSPVSKVRGCALSVDSARACLRRHHPRCAAPTGQRGMSLQEFRLVRPRIGACDRPSTCIRGHDPKGAFRAARRSAPCCTHASPRRGPVGRRYTRWRLPKLPRLWGPRLQAFQRAAPVPVNPWKLANRELGALLWASISGISGDSMHAHQVDGAGRADVPKMSQTGTCRDGCVPT